MNLFTRLALTLISIATLTLSTVHAQMRSIEPDSTFGADGVVFNPYNVAYVGTPLAMDIQSDGKIIEGLTSNGSIVAVRRFFANGILDTTFGASGYVVLNAFGYYYSQGMAIKVLASGNILVCTGAYPALTYLARITAAGVIDSTFGTSGYTTFGAYYNVDMKVLSDGTIRVIENKLISNPDTAVLIKTNANGIIDSTFGINGRIYIPQSIYVSNGIGALDHNDRIILCSGYTPTAFRVLPDGSIDHTFGNNGYSSFAADTSLTNQLHLTNCWPVALPDNSIVVPMHYAGITYAVHLFSDGTPDTTYGNSGLAATSLGYYDYPIAALALDNGEVLITGQTTIQTSSTFDAGILNVLNTSGHIDSVFSNHHTSYIDVQYDTTLGNQVTDLGPTIILPGNQIFQSGAYQGALTWISKYDYSGFVTGINNIADAPDFSLYPNPSSGQCTIEVANGVDRAYAARLMDMTGKAIGGEWSFSIQSTFSVSQYAKGIYMLRITDNNGGQATEKLVIE